MSDKNIEPKGSFWTTAPGCITAIGGLVSVVVAAIVALSTAGFIKAPFSATATPPAVATSPPVVTTSNTIMIVESTPVIAPTHPPLATSTTVPPSITPTQPIPKEEYVDTNTVEQNMHACPLGFAIAGVRADKNLLLCRRVMRSGEEGFVETILDRNTVRADMHVCPMGMYMRGLRIDQNLLLCSYDSRNGSPNDWQTEFEDTGSVDYDMHVCPVSANSIRYLTGIRADQNRFLCGIHNP